MNTYSVDFEDPHMLLAYVVVYCCRIPSMDILSGRDDDAAIEAALAGTTTSFVMCASTNAVAVAV